MHSASCIICMKMILVSHLSKHELSIHNLFEDDLSEYNLYEDDLNKHMYVDDLSKYNLYADNLSKYNLYVDDLSEYNLYSDDLSEYNLYADDFSGYDLYVDDLSEYNLYEDDLNEHNLYEDDLDSRIGMKLILVVKLVLNNRSTKFHMKIILVPNFSRLCSSISASFRFTRQNVYCIGQADLLDGQFARPASKPAGKQTGQNICMHLSIFPL